VQAGTGPPGLLSSIRSMWMAPAIALATIGYLAFARPLVLGLAAPILLLWLSAPGITWWLSRPLVRPESRLTQPQQEFLQVLARRTWAFFETFVGPEDNWLPPDNVQKQPGPMVAHRTSPTNIGLALLANVVAHDFGYLPTGRLLERTARTLRSMASLERYRGHLYNWYDTQSLQPLLPMYVSTVDSGNLAAHLLTLRVGLLALPDEPIVPRRVFAGIGDTLGVLTQSQAGDATKQQMELRRELDRQADGERPETITDAHRILLEDATAPRWAMQEALLILAHDGAAEAVETLEAFMPVAHTRLAGFAECALDEDRYFATVPHNAEERRMMKEEVRQAWEDRAVAA